MSDLVTDVSPRSASGTITDVADDMKPHADQTRTPILMGVVMAHDTPLPNTRGTPMRGVPKTMGTLLRGVVMPDLLLVVVPILVMSAVTGDKAMLASVSVRQAMNDEARVSKGAVTDQVTERATVPVPNPVPAAWHPAARSWLKPPAPNWSEPNSTMGFQGSNPLMKGCDPTREPNCIVGFQGSNPLIQGSDPFKPADPHWRSSPSADFQGSKPTNTRSS